MRKTIQIMNRKALIDMLKLIHTVKFESKNSVTESTFYEYEGVRILRIENTRENEAPSEFWMVEDTSFTWDDIAELIVRNSLSI